MIKLIRKTLYRYFLIIFIILGIISTGTVLLADGGQNPEYTITVKGEGNVRISPDIAYVSLGVEILAPTAVEAQKENIRIMNQVFSKLHSLGIKKEDIKTVQFFLWRATEYQEEKEFFQGFQVRHLVELPITDLNRMGEIIDESIRAGANVVENLYFSVKDLPKVYQQAMELAIENARVKAGAITRISGFKIIGIQQISESAVTTPSFGAEGESRKEAEIPVVPGQLRVSAVIDVTYLVSKK